MLKYAGDSDILGREEPMDLIEDEDTDVLCKLQVFISEEGNEVECLPCDRLEYQCKDCEF